MDKQAPTPPYVLALLDAYLTGKPLDFRQHEVPTEVRDILSDAVASGKLGMVRLEEPGWSDRTTDRIRDLAGGGPGTGAE